MNIYQMVVASQQDPKLRFRRRKFAQVPGDVWLHQGEFVWQLPGSDHSPIPWHPDAECCGSSDWFAYIEKTCYQCEKPVTYLFPDARCKDCTRVTPEELRGE